MEMAPKIRRCVCRVHLRGPLAEDPHRTGPRLGKSFEGHWRARRGEYRVRYRIDEADETVYVLDVDYRRDVYRR